MKKIFFITICIVLIAGCGKKQPITQKPQKPATQTQQVVSEKVSVQKQQKTPLYPEKQEKQIKQPEWVEKIVSVYDQSYKLWQEKSSTDTGTVLIASLTSSSIVTPGSSQSTTTSTPSSVSSLPGTTSILRPSETSSSITPASPRVSVSTSSISQPGTITPSPPAPSPPSPAPPDQQPSEQPVQTPGVIVVRTIQNAGDTSYIRLNVNVSDTRVSGIIVSENLPDAYTLVSSSPPISKKTGNSVKWLFYGTSLTSQEINYQIKGSGRATISGSFSSTLGSGTTTGDSQVGQ